MTETNDKRIANEKIHGEWIARHGETIWNWSSPAGKIRWERRADLFRDFLRGEGLKVLEIGCGTGLFTAEIAKTPHHVTAIDISKELLEKARVRVTTDNVTFALENAYATSFSDMSYDAVIGSSCLHHLDLRKALKEFHRLLKPGGKIFFTEPNMLNPQNALQKNIPLLKRMAGDSPDETAFVRFYLEKELRQAGFSSIRIVPFDFIHPALPACILPFTVPLLNGIEKIPLLREISGSLIIQGERQ